MKILHVLARKHLQLQEFDEAVLFYEQLFKQKARLQLEPVEGQYKITQVASMLLLGADAEFMQLIQNIDATYLVEDIHEWSQYLPTQGATIEVPITAVDTGRFMTVRHPDGLRVEYIEHSNKNKMDAVYG